MSIKEKYENIVEGENAAQAAEDSRLNSLRTDWNNQAQLFVSKKEEEKRIARNKIKENLRRSDIKSLMNEAAELKHAKMTSNKEGDAFSFDWQVNTGESSFKIWFIRFPDINYYRVSAQVQPDSILITGNEPISGKDMFDREKLELAIAKGLAHPDPARFATPGYDSTPDH